jgi:hypothetical protein
MTAGAGRTSEQDDAFVRKLADRLKRQPAMGVFVITVSEDGRAQIAEYGCDRMCWTDAQVEMSHAYSKMLEAED